MYNHNKAQQSKNRVHISWDILYAAIGALVPGKSTGAPWKTTPRQDRTLLRMVRQEYFISARALTVWIKNLYERRAGRKTVNNRLLSRGYHAYRLTRNPPLTANHHRLCLEWGAFHSGAKSPPVLPDRYPIGELYKGILRNTLMPFASSISGITTATKTISPHLTIFR